MRKHKKSQLPYRPTFQFRRTNPDRERQDIPAPRPRKIKRTLIVFASLAAVNIAAALINPWLGILASFLLGPAYIITGIVLAVYAFTETSTLAAFSEAEPSVEDDRKRKKKRNTVAVVALLLIIAVVVFLLLLNNAVSHIDFR